MDVSIFIHFLQIKVFSLFILCSLLLPSSFAQYPQSKIPLGELKVRVLKRKQIHIKTAALLCALYKNGGTSEKINEAWSERFVSPISADDEYLVKSIMKGMCPEIY